MKEGGFNVGAAFRRGVERMRDALGPDVADAVDHDRAKAADRGDAERVELPIALTWGWLMDRPGLTPRERVLAMLAVDVARGTRRALDEHLQLAASVGISGAELRELFLQLGPYAGYPALNDAWEVLGKHLRRNASVPAPASTRAAADARTPARPNGWLGAPARLLSIGVVVDDAARAATEFAELIGISTWSVTRIDSGRAELVVGGQPIEYELLRAVGTTATGVRIELVEPRRGATPAHLALLSRGPGIVSVIVAESADEDDLFRAAPTPFTRRAVWRTPGAASLHSLDTRAELGFRAELATPSLTAFDEGLGADETWRLGAGAGGLVPLGPFGHLGAVVPDLERATREHAKAFGRSRWPVLRFSTENGTLTHARYGDGPGTEAYLSSVAKVGGFAMELIQPTAGPSRYREGFLQPRGAGVHHLFFGPLTDGERWDELVAALRDHGYPLVTDAYGWDDALEYAYVDALERIGFDVELVRMIRPIELRTSDHAFLTFEHSIYDDTEQPWRLAR